MAADKYLATELIADLADHLEKNISDVSNVCMIYDQLLKMKLDDKKAKLMIALRSPDAFASESFRQIDESTLISILRFNSLNIAELDLLKASMRWTDSEVARQGLVANQANKRAVFKPIKHLIRFGDLGLTGFGSIPEIKGYLTFEEIASVFFHLSNPNEPIQIDYRSPRRSRLTTARAITEEFFENAQQQPTYWIRVSKPVSISSIRTVETSAYAKLKIEWVSPDGKVTTLQGKRGNTFNTLTVDFDPKSTKTLMPNSKYELRFSFDSFNYFNEVSKQMSLKTEKGETVFEIESNLGYHLIKSIDFFCAI